MVEMFDMWIFLIPFAGPQKTVLTVRYLLFPYCIASYSLILSINKYIYVYIHRCLVCSLSYVELFRAMGHHVNQRFALCGFDWSLLSCIMLCLIITFPFSCFFKSHVNHWICWSNEQVTNVLAWVLRFICVHTSTHCCGNSIFRWQRGRETSQWPTSL